MNRRTFLLGMGALGGSGLLFGCAALFGTKAAQGRSDSGAAQRLLRWIASLPDRAEDRLISGQHVGFGEGVAGGYQRYVVELHRQTGRWVALVGADYGYGRRWDESRGHWDLLGGTNPTLIEHWGRSGLVTVSWHAPNPWTRKSSWDKSPDDDLTALVDPADPMNAVWKADLDRVAAALKDLQQVGVIVLWRPFHENTGGWFWWGKNTHPGDPEPFKALWRHMYGYFTNEWGLDHLIWVYAAAESSLANTVPPETNYPSDDYVDIVGESHYRVGNGHGGNPVGPPGYAALSALGKPYMLTEFGPNLQVPAGSYDYAELPRELRAGFLRTVGWYSWGDDTSGSPKRAIVSNRNAIGLFNDPWVIDVEKVDW